MAAVEEVRSSGGSLLYDPRVRGIAYQVIVVAGLAALVYFAASNAKENLDRAHIATGIDFLRRNAGFDINQRFIEYNAAVGTYGRALVVGLLNTLYVAAIGIILATILGFLLGVARLSTNWMIAKLASGYVELVRNVPLLLQLFFWYNAVLKPLPQPRESLAVPGLTLGLPDPLPFLAALALTAAVYAIVRMARRLEPAAGVVAKALAGIVALGALIVFVRWSGLIQTTDGGIIFLNVRGLFLPEPFFHAAARYVVALFVLGIVGAVVFYMWARREQARTGVQYPVGLMALALIVVLPGLVWLGFSLAGNNPITFDYAKQGRFNLTGGLQVFPEFVALLIGLVMYTAAFIAEIVRAGILAVSKGQTEAARSLGLRAGPTLRLVIIPQAMRVIIPPLTNQYLNLTKNSSLAVAIGYPDLAQIFMGTVLNQTGQAIEVIGITMAIYLFISLVTSLGMNIYNRRVAIVER
jgi:general L-amino acid transport system permease protein